MSLSRYSPRRVMAVTVGLSASGAVFGGIAGVAMTAAMALGIPGFWTAREVLAMGIVGATLGVVCAPIAGWLLLRRVPLGKAFVRLTIGTVVGGVIGWYLPWSNALGPFYQSLITAGMGFLAAALVLRFTHGVTVPPDSASSDAP